MHSTRAIVDYYLHSNIFGSHFQSQQAIAPVSLLGDIQRYDMKKMILTVLSLSRFAGMQSDRLATVAAKDDAKTVVRKHAVCGALFKRFNANPAHLNTFDLFFRRTVALGRMAILENR